MNLNMIMNTLYALDPPIIKHEPLILTSMEQGSLEWLMARIGRVTASNMHKLLRGGEGKTRDSYLLEVASEKVTGVPSEKVNTWDMVRGNTLEPYAIQAYEAVTGLKVKRVGLIYLNKDKRVAASPDGLTMYDERLIRYMGGVELKCPNPKNHAKTIIEGKSPKKYDAQLQGSMWVSGALNWDFVSFCPEFKQRPLFMVTAKRDEAMIDKIRAATEAAIIKIDEYVQQFMSDPVDERLSKILSEASQMVEMLKEPEIY